MKIRIQYIHKVSPRYETDREVVDGSVTDLTDLDSVRRLLKRHKQECPNSEHDRQETDEEGKKRFVLFPRRSIWHSIIVSEETP